METQVPMVEMETFQESLVLERIDLTTFLLTLALSVGLVMSTL